MRCQPCWPITCGHGWSSWCHQGRVVVMGNGRREIWRETGDLVGDGRFDGRWEDGGIAGRARTAAASSAAASSAAASAGAGSVSMASAGAAAAGVASAGASKPDPRSPT